jgi:hypothetical protein
MYQRKSNYTLLIKNQKNIYSVLFSVSADVQRVVPCGMIGGQTDMTKLTIAFHSFANAPEVSGFMFPIPLYTIVAFTEKNTFLQSFHAVKLQTAQIRVLFWRSLCSVCGKKMSIA